MDGCAMLQRLPRVTLALLLLLLLLLLLPSTLPGCLDRVDLPRCNAGSLC
jgi:hypothetical protein